MASQRQIKGIIAIAILMAMIPFFRFFKTSFMDFQEPAFSRSNQENIAVEILQSHGSSGIYFIDRSMTLNELLQVNDPDKTIKKTLKLQNGMAIKLTGDGQNQDISITTMAAAKKLALSLTIDVNQATRDDLILIPGVGEKTAEKIVSRRREIGGFGHINQLMEIDGIKEKKLAKLSKYLHAGNDADRNH